MNLTLEHRFDVTNDCRFCGVTQWEQYRPCITLMQWIVKVQDSIDFLISQALPIEKRIAP